EILRLHLAARTWLSLSAQKAAAGEPSINGTSTLNPSPKQGETVPDGVSLYATPDQRAMCAHVLLDTPGKFIVSLNLLATLIGLFVGLLLLLFGLPLLERPLWRFVGADVVRWRSYGFAQLHRMVSEKTTGVYWTGA